MIPCSKCSLRKLPAFKTLEPSRLTSIQKIKSAHISLGPGVDIIAPEQESDDMYTLFSGWAFRYKELADGRRQILNFLLPGDLVGLQASMFNAAQHGIATLTEVQLCVLPRRKVWTVFETMPDLAFDITWLGAREESIIDQNLLAVGRMNARERVAALIIGLYKRCNALGLVKDGVFAFPLNQHHIADALGLSLAHTNKTLAYLRRIGMFTLEGGTMDLTNPRALQRMGQVFDAEFQARPLI
jgi:CRP-like cAMP-binding protein